MFRFTRSLFLWFSMLPFPSLQLFAVDETDLCLGKAWESFSSAELKKCLENGSKPDALIKFKLPLEIPNNYETMTEYILQAVALKPVSADAIPEKLQMMKILVEHGANLYLWHFSPDAYPRWPVADAWKNKKIDGTPLALVAADRNALPIVEYLLSVGAKAIYAKDYEDPRIGYQHCGGAIALEELFAAWEGRLSEVKHVIKQMIDRRGLAEYGCDVYGLHYRPWTIHYPAKNLFTQFIHEDLMELLELLYQRLPKDHRQWFKDGDLGLEGGANGIFFAVQKNSPKLVEKLIALKVPVPALLEFSSNKFVKWKTLLNFTNNDEVKELLEKEGVVSVEVLISNLKKVIEERDWATIAATVEKLQSKFATDYAFADKEVSELQREVKIAALDDAFNHDNRAGLTWLTDRKVNFGDWAFFQLAVAQNNYEMAKWLVANAGYAPFNLMDNVYGRKWLQDLATTDSPDYRWLDLVEPMFFKNGSYLQSFIDDFVREYNIASLNLPRVIDYLISRGTPINYVWQGPGVHPRNVVEVMIYKGSMAWKDPASQAAVGEFMTYLHSKGASFANAVWHTIYWGNGRMLDSPELQKQFTSFLALIRSLSGQSIDEPMIGEYWFSYDRKFRDVTPLEIAIAGSLKPLALVTVLIEAGADANAINPKQSNRTALMLAAATVKESGVVGYLLEHNAEINAVDSANQTALDYAINAGQVDNQIFLARKGALRGSEIK